MTAGDVVNGISGDNAALTFRPAAGVECVITSIGVDASGTNIRHLYNGTNASQITNSTTNYYLVYGSMKIFINNTNYMIIVALGAGKFGSYSGIQTK